MATGATGSGPLPESAPGAPVLVTGAAGYIGSHAVLALREAGYDWAFTSRPTGSEATLLGATTQSPSFVAADAGTYVIELVVTDQDGAASAPDAVQVSSDNLAPTADAGSDQLVIVGDTVFLDGSASSDPEGDALTYSWALISTPADSAAALNGADTATPNFIPDVEGNYSIGLDVADLIGSGAPDTVDIAATTAEDFAEIQIVSVDETVTTLDPDFGEVTTEGNQTAYNNFLRQAALALQEDDLEEAINKLRKAIGRTDGCILRGEPDANGPGRDWISDCAVQTEIYNQLNAALAGLTS